MKERMQAEIENFIRGYQRRDNIDTGFGRPLVGVADAFAEEIQGLRQVIAPDYVLPQDVLPDAKSVIAYYVPFTRELAESNKAEPRVASLQWARAYEELNGLFAELNVRLVKLVEQEGGRAEVPAAASVFDRSELVSSWSHRHVAYAAGLGTFGINNMLITREGCCGRFSSIVTDMGAEKFEFDKPAAGELCLYKADGTCGVCMKNCPGAALDPEKKDKFGAGFERSKCYEICQENAARYPVPADLTSSYAATGSQVCGKCITGSPCAFWDDAPDTGLGAESIRSR